MPETFDHFSASFEPEPRAGKRNSGGTPPIVGKKLQEDCEKIGILGNKSRRCVVVTVVNDPGSGIAAKQPN
jgi:hypothetical protein